MMFNNVYIENIKRYYHIKITEDNLKMVSKDKKYNMDIPVDNIVGISNENIKKPQKKKWQFFYYLAVITFLFTVSTNGNFTLLFVSFVIGIIFYLMSQAMNHKAIISLYNDIESHKIEKVYIRFKSSDEKDAFIAKFNELLIGVNSKYKTINSIQKPIASKTRKAGFEVMTVFKNITDAISEIFEKVKFNNKQKKEKKVIN